MRTAMILHIHSTADVITNSSSELFLCNTEKTEEQIREMLDVIADFVGGHGVGSIRTYQGIDGLIEALNSFDSGYWQSNLYSILCKFIPYEILEKVKVPQFASSWEATSKIKDWEERYAFQDRLENQHKATVQSFMNDNRALFEPHIKTVTILEGASDNSIPYDIFDMLETRLHAVRFHLG